MKMLLWALILAITNSSPFKATPINVEHTQYQMHGDIRHNLDFDPKERELLHASLLCDWEPFEQTISQLPEETTLNPVVIPTTKTTLKQFRQYVPAQDDEHARVAVGGIHKLSTVQAIVARFCPAKFLKRSIDRTGSMGRGSWSQYAKDSHASAYDSGLTWDAFNAQSLESIAAMSTIEKKEKMKIITEAQTKSKHK